MTRSSFVWGVEGPVQAEVFVVWLHGDVIELTGPDGPVPWLLELGATEHPVEVVDRIVRDARTDLARSEATVAPRDIATDQVVEHALRHLAWLAEDDPVVREELSAGWKAALATYVPEPFRNLG